MSTMATTPTRPATRFQAARLPNGGWTVTDQLDKPSIVTGRTWDEDRARAWAGLLDEAPAYAVLFQWSQPDLYWPMASQGGGKR